MIFKQRLDLWDEAISLQESQRLAVPRDDLRYLSGIEPISLFARLEIRKTIEMKGFDKILSDMIDLWFYAILDAVTLLTEYLGAGGLDIAEEDLADFQWSAAVLAAAALGSTVYFC